MSSFFKRASDIVEAKINNFLSRAENPNDTLDLSYERMLSGLQETRRNLADVVTEQKSLEHQMYAAQLEIQHVFLAYKLLLTLEYRLMQHNYSFRYMNTYAHTPVYTARRAG